MKAYRGVDGKVRLFRPDMNMARMNRSALRAGLPTFDIDEMTRCICRLVQIDQEWVPHSETASLYIRPTFIGIDVRTYLSVKFLLNQLKEIGQMPTPLPVRATPGW